MLFSRGSQWIIKPGKKHVLNSENCHFSKLCKLIPAKITNGEQQIQQLASLNAFLVSDELKQQSSELWFSTNVIIRRSSMKEVNIRRCMLVVPSTSKRPRASVIMSVAYFIVHTFYLLVQSLKYRHTPNPVFNQQIKETLFWCFF